MKLHTVEEYSVYHLNQANYQTNKINLKMYEFGGVTIYFLTCPIFNQKLWDIQRNKSMLNTQEKNTQKEHVLDVIKYWI